MGCYGIGIGRLLAATIEQNHDERGIVFPVPIAPYQVSLIGLNLQDPSVLKEVEAFYDSLWNEGIECLFRIIENVNEVCDGKIINIGNPANEASIEQLAEILVKKFLEHPVKMKIFRNQAS